MQPTVKGKIYLFVFVSTALLLAWGVWNNYRPQVILATCSDMASKSSSILKKRTLENTDYQYNQALQDCLKDAGI